MNRFLVFSVVVTGVLLAGCSGIKVTADQGETTDYSKYKTYSFMGWQSDSEDLLPGTVHPEYIGANLEPLFDSNDPPLPFWTVRSGWYRRR